MKTLTMVTRCAARGDIRRSAVVLSGAKHLLLALLLVLFTLCVRPQSASAQENYEIQVYGSETMAPGTTMFELHSNFATSGRKFTENGLLPTHHQLHETVEITHGFNSWSELGVYFFTSAAQGQSVRYVGSHLRPRVRAPESWNWPVGASLSLEVGFQNREFSEETWSVEIRPIIDKQFGPWYASFNPVLGKSLRGGDNAYEFTPNIAVNRDFSPVVNLGVEYYGGWGPVNNLAPSNERAHQLFGVVNLDLDPNWEFNAGVGVGFTAMQERGMIKLILGRRIGAVEEKH